MRDTSCRSFCRNVAFAALTILISSGCQDPSNPATASLDQGNVPDPAETCNSFVSSSSLSEICTFLNQLGLSCTPSSKCSLQTQELYAGSTLKAPAKAPYEWNYWGGVGPSLADASVCILRDLSKGTKSIPADTQLFGLHFPVNQTIGFTNFDPVTLTFKGYQRVQVCVPVAGCFDAKIQGITAQVNEDNPADGNGISPLHAGTYGITQSYGLILTVEESQEGFNASAPAIVIATPYGNVSVTPSMGYSSTMATTLFQSGDANVDIGLPNFIPQLANVIGNDGGVDQETLGKYTVPDYGWVSQAGIGSRAASHPSDPIWSASSNQPRPDIQGMTTARTQDELRPVADYYADVNISFSPPIPSFIEVPLQVSPFDIYVDPKAEIAYSTQLEAEFAQGYTKPVADEGVETLGSLAIKARAEALASFTLNAGVDLVISINLPFYTAKIVDAHPKISIPLDTNPGSNELLIGQAKTEPNPTSSGANQTYNASLTAIQTTPNSGSPSNPGQFINQCLAVPVAGQPVPKPSYTPGNGQVFQNNLYYPCNICVGFPDYSYPTTPAKTTWVPVTGQAQLNTPSTQPDKAWTCDPDHVGCMDLCQYFPGSSPFTESTLTVYKNAMQLGVTSAIHTGLACNQPYRPVQ